MKQNTASLVEGLKTRVGDARLGLPEEVFEFVSQITPLVNVDLLIRDEEKGTLLTWREDEFYGAGWHIPGGIIRFKETFAERIQNVANNELGAKVTHAAVPMTINEVIHPASSVRGHFISLLFACRLASPLAKSLSCGNQPRKGHWRWHKSCPDDLIAVHEIYREFITEEVKL